MKRTVVFVVFACVATVGLIGVMVLLIHRPDASATFISTLVTVLSLISVFAGTAYGLGKLNEKVDTVQKQTNGQLEKRDARLETYQRIMRENGIDYDAIERSNTNV